MKGAHEPIYFGWKAFLLLGASSVICIGSTAMYVLYVFVRARYGATHLSSELPKTIKSIFRVSYSVAVVAMLVGTFGTLATDSLRWNAIRHVSLLVMSLAGITVMIHSIVVLRSEIESHRRQMSSKDIKLSALIQERSTWSNRGCRKPKTRTSSRSPPRPTSHDTLSSSALTIIPEYSRHNSNAKTTNSSRICMHMPPLTSTRTLPPSATDSEQVAADCSSASPPTQITMLTHDETVMKPANRRSTCFVNRQSNYHDAFPPEIDPLRAPLRHLLVYMIVFIVAASLCIFILVYLAVDQFMDSNNYSWGVDYGSRNYGFFNDFNDVVKIVAIGAFQYYAKNPW